jgi:AcrR family transcriptional regulator
MRETADPAIMDGIWRNGAESEVRTKARLKAADLRDPESSDQAYVSDSRTEILRTAAEVFTEYGYAATSIDLIAERLGSTKGRVYHHFDSKPDLFFEIQIVAMKTLIGQIAPISEGPSDPMDKLSRMALKHTQMLIADYAIQKVAIQGLERRLLGDAATKHVKTLRSIVQKRKEYEALFSKIIAEGAKAGQFIDIPVGLAVKALFGTINWITIWYSPRKGQPQKELDVIARTLADIAIRGLAPK